MTVREAIYIICLSPQGPLPEIYPLISEALRIVSTDEMEASDIEAAPALTSGVEVGHLGSQSSLQSPVSADFE